MKAKPVLSLALRLIAALILLQTLYFKFTGHPESVALFSKLGVEPWGRIGTGVLELIASLLLLFRSTVILGAIMGMGLMAGAIASHLLVIGIESAGDGGQLFMLAIIVFTCCAILAFLHRNQLPELRRKYLRR